MGDAGPVPDLCFAQPLQTDVAGSLVDVSGKPHRMGVGLKQKQRIMSTQGLFEGFFVKH